MSLAAISWNGDIIPYQEEAATKLFVSGVAFLLMVGPLLPAPDDLQVVITPGYGPPGMPGYDPTPHELHCH